MLGTRSTIKCQARETITCARTCAHNHPKKKSSLTNLSQAFTEGQSQSADGELERVVDDTHGPLLGFTNFCKDVLCQFTKHSTYKSDIFHFRDACFTIIMPNSIMALAMNFLRSRDTIALTTVPLNPENQISSQVLIGLITYEKIIQFKPHPTWEKV